MTTPDMRKAPEGPDAADTAAKPLDDAQRTDPEYYPRLMERFGVLLDMDRRRREAARRLPPMVDGHRDPVGPRSDGAA